MILISVGTQNFPFDRLLRQVDQLIETGIIRDQVVAQVGHCIYRPRHCTTFGFASEQELQDCIYHCDLLITHGGIGTITQGLTYGKKVIIVPRQQKFGEHVDDHQMEIASQFWKMNYALPCYDVEQLGDAIRRISGMTFREYRFSFEKPAAYIQRYLNALEGNGTSL